MSGLAGYTLTCRKCGELSGVFTVLAEARDRAEAHNLTRSAQRDYGHVTQAGVKCVCGRWFKTAGGARLHWTRCPSRY